jgi:transcriptional regulator with XRE-family HTH domain
MTSIQKIFAHNLKNKRQNCGFSQAKLAEMVGVSTHHIAMMEIARHYPTLELVERMANALNTEIYELFIDPLSPPEEMERLYQTVAKDIDQLFKTTAENIEKAVNQSIKNALADGQIKRSD